MKRYLISQTGAALLLVLFVVVFLSIVGAGMLASTTYSLKSIKNNEEVQKEFYAAEGTLDLVLEDISRTPSLYNDLDALGKNETLEMASPSTGIYKIGSAEVDVYLTKLNKLENKSNGERDSIKALVTAQYKNKSKLERELEIEIFEPVGTSSHSIFYASLASKIDIKNADSTAVLKQVDRLHNVLRRYFMDHYEPILIGNNDFKHNQETIIGDASSKKKVYRYIGNLEMSTHEDLIVRPNTVLIIDGQLYQKGQAVLKIEEGALVIVNDMKIGNGNDALNIIDGAIVANLITSQGNGNGIDMNVEIGIHAGLSCDLVEELIKYIDGLISTLGVDDLAALLGIKLSVGSTLLGILKSLGLGLTNTLDVLLDANIRGLGSILNPVLRSGNKSN